MASILTRTQGNIHTIYSAGWVTTATASGAMLFEIRAGTFPLRLIELSVANTAATTGAFGIGMPSTIGTGVSTSVPFLNEQSGGLIAHASAIVATAWGGAAPGAVANSLYRDTTAASIGSTWRLDVSDLWIPAGKSLICFNAGAGACSVVNCYAVVESKDQA